jgi:hypothetical protein
MQRRHDGSATIAGHSTASAVRLLVESGDPAFHVDDFTRFRAAGFDVVLCSGADDADRPCPVLEGRPCELLDAADVVLFDLASPKPASRAVLEAVCGQAPDVPVVVTTPPASAAGDDVPPGCTTIRSTTSVAGQLEVLRHAVVRAQP